MSDAGKCHLMRYWKRQEKPAELPIQPDVLRAMQVGIILHNWIQMVMQSSQDLLVLGIEQELEDEHRLGHYDALLNIDGKLTLYDFKTINGKKAYYLENHGRNADLPHQYQLVSYASLLDPRPDELRIAYIERESLRVAKECPVTYEYVISSVQKDWNTLIKAWEDQREPVANPDSWECKYCQYCVHCGHKRA
jgi:CRISPR/Cas system-associated exonuclease Cas4 (RecB family)